MNISNSIIISAFNFFGVACAPLLSACSCVTPLLAVGKVVVYLVMVITGTDCLVKVIT